MRSAPYPFIALALVASLVVAGCGRVERPAPARPHPVPRLAQGLDERDTRACEADLTRMGVRFTPLADHDYGGGCALIGTVALLDVGVPVTGLGPVRCGAARAFAGWVRGAVVPAAYQLLGSEVARVDTLGSYACRNVIGSAASAGRRSGHAIADAVDVGGFVLKDGRRVTIARDWSSPDEATHGFLAAIHRSACRRFGTVLSPDYNAAHHDHLHLEDDGAAFCR